VIAGGAARRAVESDRPVERTPRVRSSPRRLPARALRAARAAVALALALASCAGPTPAPAPTAPLPASTAPATASATSLPAGGEVPGETAPEATLPDPLGDAEEPTPEDDELSTGADGKPPACSMERRHLAAVERAILAAPRKGPATPAPSSPGASARAKPARLDLVARRFGLSDAERARLSANGFVVPERLEQPSYTVAYHELYQSELPLYVTADSIFHALFVSHEELLEEIEGRRVAPALGRALAKLAAALPDAVRSLPAETAGDLALYVAVARSLFEGSYAEGPAEARALVDLAMKADGLATVELFGRPRRVDFSLYQPRAHYAGSRPLARYFRAATWLSRLELNLASRSCRSSEPGLVPDPSETPREALLALALADLAERSGALADLDLVETAFGLFGGVREDVPLRALVALRREAGIASLAEPAAAERLRAAIGDRFRRTARLHPMPEGSTELPAIATVLGPRVVPDSAATRPLVNGEVPGRHVLGAADLAHAFGHDRAERYLAPDLARFPELRAGLAKARAVVHAPTPGKDLYGAWLAAIRGLAVEPAGALPSFARTEAFRDLRIASFVAAYGQLRHANVLLAGQSYDEGACEVPDGFVEPVPAVWAGLAEYADRGLAAMTTLDPKGALGGKGFFERLGTIARVLGAITDAELSGQPLSREALAFLSMVVEIHGVDIGTGYSTTYNGWYFDLFLTRPALTTEPPPGRPEHASMKDASFLADFYTSTHVRTVAYAGATRPRLGLFVVDVGGPPRVVVGPVAHAFEHHAPLATRLGDDAVPTLASREEPWSASYAVPAPPEPAFVVHVANGEAAYYSEVEAHRSLPLEVTIDAPRALGRVTVERLDHHRRPVATLAREVAAGATRFVFPARPQRVLPGTRATEMVAIRVGDFRAFVDTVAGPRARAFGGLSLPPDDAR
jgi:hypothetical protein